MWKTALSAAVLTVALVPAAHADDFDKLTLLTFSAPVDLPGITLPAGTYRFALADPESGRRAIRVMDKDGKQLGMFLSVPNQRMTATDNPVVMFKEAAAGAPAAVQAWFYPAEHTGYEFVYPHDQALKIAKATHESVLAKNGDDVVSRIDENDRPVSSDEKLKEAKATHQTGATSPSATTASASTTSQTSNTGSTSMTAPASTTSSGATSAPASTTASTTAPSARTRTSASTTASASNTAPASTTASARRQHQSAVGSSGTASATPAPAPMTNTADTAKPARKHLPRTASPLPLLLLLSSASFAGAFGVRAARQSL